MPSFEVQIPDSTGDSVSFTMQIDAVDWMSALTACLDEFGQELDTASARCSLAPDGAVHVTAGEGAARYIVRPLDGDGLGSILPIGATGVDDVPTETELPLISMEVANTVRDRRRSVVHTTDPMMPMGLLAEQESARGAGQVFRIPDAPSASPGGVDGARGPRPATRPGLPVSPRPRALVPRNVSPTRLLAALNKLSSSHANAEQVIDHAVALLYDEVAAEAVQLVLPDHSGEGWRVVAARGREAGALVLTRLTLGADVASTLDEAEAPVRLAGAVTVLSYENRRGRVTELSAESVMLAPITSGGDRIGAVVLARDGDPFDDGVAELMDRLGSELGALLGTRL